VVRFSLASHTTYPYQLCYCTICRKTAGGGGFAINIMGDAETMKLRGKAQVGVYRVRFDRTLSSGRRHFCKACATALWVSDPEWPELVHPFASAIDSDLPAPPSKVHMMLAYKASWVKPDIGRGDLKFREYPKQSIEEWHRSKGLWIE
jgi:hypothetical protein